MTEQEQPQEAIITDVDKFAQYIFQIYHILEKMEALIKKESEK